jgi:hypothetical protein
MAPVSSADVRPAGAERARPRLLAIYLNDHLAGSNAVVTRVRRAARAHEHEELGRFLAALAVEIEADRGALLRVMAAASARPQRVKLGLARAAEVAGRLKLNGRLLRRSPLSVLVELEATELGITGKLLLWQALRAARPPGSEAVDLDVLIDRAEAQRADVERRRRAASDALNR